MAYPNLSPNQTDAFSRIMAESFSDKDLIGSPVGFLSFYDNGRTLWTNDALVVDIDIQKNT